MKEKERDINSNYLDDLDDLDFGGRSDDDTSEKIEYVESNIWTKLEAVGKKISFAKDILALVNYMRDSYVSWHRKAIVVGALIYFISPIDIIPDLAPLFGYLDDLGVIAALLKFLGSELIPYYKPGYRE
ncbi:MAG: YkvA family protein [Ignavibacteria bacterium]|nr:YkvA family protein [Ignavibacteria bacterium]